MPRHGAGILRERGDRPDPEFPIRADQGGPRGAARPGPRLHDRLPGAHRIRRLALDRDPDARRASVPRGHLLPAGDAVRPPGSEGGPVPGALGLGRAARARGKRGGADRGGRARRVRRNAGRAARRLPVDPGVRAPPAALRRGVRRVRHRAQIPDAPARVPSPLLEADRRRTRARPGGAHAPLDPEGRHLRPDRVRRAPLFHRPRVAGSPLREDALRPSPADDGVRRGAPGDRRRPLCLGGAGDRDLRRARSDVPRGGLLFRGGCGQRRGGGEVLRLEPRRDSRGARGRGGGALRARLRRRGEGELDRPRRGRAPDRHQHPPPDRGSAGPGPGGWRPIA